jgi:fructose-1,6-bisphosphatase/inositol monophosphatase family enzyme
MTVDLSAVAQIIRDAAEECVLPHFRTLTSDQISTKTGPQDFVTAADLECEAFLSRELRALMPGSLVVGEEGVAEQPELLDYLNGSAPVWIIDPVDGTFNFTKGDERFAIIVALARNGRTEAGWIYTPITGQMLMTESGSGAYEEDRKLVVNKPQSIKEMTAVLYVAKRRAPELYDRLKATQDEIGPRRFSRCAAAEYVDLVTGAADYAIFTKLLPWDHAAGILLHAEAGGTAKYMDDDAYELPGQDKPFMLAPDSDSWQELKAFFTD